MALRSTGPLCGELLLLMILILMIIVIIVIIIINQGEVSSAGSDE